MADFTFVTDRVATGAALQNAQDVEQLVKAGVTDVVDCRAEFDDAPLFNQDPNILGYLYDPTQDDGQPKPADWFEKCAQFAGPVLGQPHRKVYAHCAAGINRGPSMAYFILRMQGIPSATAENLIRTVRPQVGLRYKGDADSAITVLGY